MLPGVVVLTFCLIALLAAGVWSIRYVLVEVPSEMASRSVQGVVSAAKQIAADVAEALQVRPEVVVGSETVVRQDTEKLQLVTVERTLRQSYRWEHSWLQSTKVFEIEGDFVVKAGFDLEKPFVITVDPDSANLRASLPPPEIFSVELTGFRIVEDKDGFWNKLTSQDREQAVRELRLRAARKTRDSDLDAEARRAVEARLRNVLARNDRGILFEYPPPR